MVYSYEEYKNGMGRRALNSYLKYGYIPLEDSVPEAFHTVSYTHLGRQRLSVLFGIFAEKFCGVGCA